VNRDDIRGVHPKCHGELVEAAIVIAIGIAISLLDGRFTRLTAIIKARLPSSYPLPSSPSKQPQQQATKHLYSKTSQQSTTSTSTQSHINRNHV
jgi:hypothetical protein